MSDPQQNASFLFSDVEGSTAIWETAPQAMSAALARHDDLVREAIEACGGEVFKTVGDGFHAVFASPLVAVDAAIAVQRRLTNEPWLSDAFLRVRVAIHSGPAEQRCDDYFGPTLNRVARILSIAHGGQILLSGSTAASVIGAAGPDVALTDLGEHHLKDLIAPERIYQVCASGLPNCFPPLCCVAQAAITPSTSSANVVGRRPVRHTRHPHARQRRRALAVSRRSPST